MNKHRDGHGEHHELEDRLSAALERQVAPFEPGEDSFVRLQERARAADAAPSRRRTTPGYLAAAAAVLILVAGGGYLLGQRQSSTVEAIDVAPAATTMPSHASDEAEEADDDPVPEEPEPVVTTTTEPPRTYQGGAAFTGPRRESVEAAAAAFLELIGVEYSQLTADGLITTVETTIDGGTAGGVVVLRLEEVEVVKGTPGFTVVGASTSSVQIASPAPHDETTTTPLVVRGQGVGREGTVEVRLLSASDGSLLAISSARAGVATPQPFTADLEVNGADWAWLVVYGGGTDTEPSGFAAIPVSFTVSATSAVYVVHGIAPDDPDGGLNVRALPDPVDGEVVAVLGEGTGGIERRARRPVFVGDVMWWNISVNLAGETVEGWVDSRFLIDQEKAQAISDQELLEVARAFTEAGLERDSAALASLPWVAEREIPFGWWGGMTPLSATDLTDESFWNDSHEWQMPAEVSEPIITLSTLSLLDLAADPLYFVDDQPSPYGLDQQVVEERFAGLRRVTIVAGEPEDEWRTTTLFFERSAAGEVAIVAVGVTVWIP